MAALEYPALTGLYFKTKLSLLVRASLQPPWLPVDGVDMNDRQTCAQPELTRQSAFARPGLANNHHPLHRSSFSPCKLIFWGWRFYVNGRLRQR